MRTVFCCVASRNTQRVSYWGFLSRILNRACRPAGLLPRAGIKPSGRAQPSRGEYNSFLSPARAAGAPTFCDATESRQRSQPRGLRPLGHPPPFFGLPSQESSARRPPPEAALRPGRQGRQCKASRAARQNFSDQDSHAFLLAPPPRRGGRPTPPPAASRNVRFAHLRCRWRRPLFHKTGFPQKALTARLGKYFRFNSSLKRSISLLRRGARGLKELRSGRAGRPYAGRAVPPGTRYGPFGREICHEKPSPRVPSGTRTKEKTPHPAKTDNNESGKRFPNP